MKKLLILGAGFLQKFIIERARELGYYVIAADKNPDSVGFAAANESAVVDIVDPLACLEFAKKKNIDGVMTAATDYGVLAASYVADELGLPGIKPEVAAIIKNKYLVRKTLSAHGVDCVKQFYEISSMEDIDALEGKLSFPLMVKPCDGSGSKAAGRVDSFEEFKSACLDAMLASLIGKAVAEDFITGKEYGAESFVYDGVPHVMAVMEKLMTQPPYYAELGHSVPCSLTFEQRVRETVEGALRALGVNFGAINMDMLITDSGEICIVDIGARMGGNLIGSHIVPLGTGILYMDILIRAAVGDSFELSPTNEGVPVSTRLLALTPGKVAALPDFAAIEKKYDVRFYHHLSVGDVINLYKNNLDGCGYIVSTDTNVERAKEKVRLALLETDRSIVRE